jgi:hypothetical protein
MDVDPPASVLRWPLVGRRWKVELNGAKAFNGGVYGMSLDGDVEAAGSEESIWDVLRAVIDEAEVVLTEMEQVKEIRIVLNSRKQSGRKN